MEENNNVQNNLNNDINTNQVVNNTQPVNNNTDNNLSGNKNKKGLEILIIGIIVLLVSGIIYFLVFNGDKDTPKNSDNTSEQEKEKDTEEDNKETEGKQGDYELTVYKNDENDSLVIREEDVDNEHVIKAFTIKVSSNEAKVLAVDEDDSLFVLYNDNGVYLYNVIAKKSEKINIEDNYKAYNIFTNEAKTKVIGIAYLDSNDKVGYYNVANNKKLYNIKYKSYQTTGAEDYAGYYQNLRFSINQVNDNNIYIRTYEGIYLLSSTIEKENISYKYETERACIDNYTSYESNGTYIYTFKSCITEYCGITNIYDDNYKEIYNGEVSDDIFSFYNKTIYLAERKDISKYKIRKLDSKGKELFSTDKDYVVNMIVDNYIVYTNDNIMIIENIDNSEESKEIVKLDKGWSFIDYESGYRRSKDNKKEGIYIVVNYSGDTGENSTVEYCYTKDKELIKYPSN